MAEHPHVAEALLHLARDLQAQPDTASLMRTIVTSARRWLVGVDHVGICILQRSGVVETAAGTGPLVWELDALQVASDEGPCLDAVRTSPIMVAQQLRHEQRWSTYVPLALRRGVTAQMGLRLHLENQTLGGLNLYCTGVEEIDPAVQDLATLVAEYAGLSLARARQAENLQRALDTRTVIGQALGIVMERYQLDEDRAFGFLVRVSQASNVNLRVIAQDLVDQVNSSPTE